MFKRMRRIGDYGHDQIEQSRTEEVSAALEWGDRHDRAVAMMDLVVVRRRPSKNSEIERQNGAVE